MISVIHESRGTLVYANEQVEGYREVEDLGIFKIYAIEPYWFYPNSRIVNKFIARYNVPSEFFKVYVSKARLFKFAEDEIQDLEFKEQPATEWVWDAEPRFSSFYDNDTNWEVRPNKEPVWIERYKKSWDDETGNTPVWTVSKPYWDDVEGRPRGTPVNHKGPFLNGYGDGLIGEGDDRLAIGRSKKNISLPITWQYLDMPTTPTVSNISLLELKPSRKSLTHAGLSGSNKSYGNAVDLLVTSENDLVRRDASYLFNDESVSFSNFTLSNLRKQSTVNKNEPISSSAIVGMVPYENRGDIFKNDYYSKLIKKRKELDQPSKPYAFSRQWYHATDYVSYYNTIAHHSVQKTGYNIYANANEKMTLDKMTLFTTVLNVIIEGFSVLASAEVINNAMTYFKNWLVEEAKYKDAIQNFDVDNSAQALDQHLSLPFTTLTVPVAKMKKGVKLETVNNREQMPTMWGENYFDLEVNKWYNNIKDAMYEFDVLTSRQYNRYLTSYWVNSAFRFPYLLKVELAVESEYSKYFEKLVHTNELAIDEEYTKEPTRPIIF